MLAGVSLTIAFLSGPSWSFLLIFGLIFSDIKGN